MEKVEENLLVLQSNLTNSVTNKRKNEIWAATANAVNAVGVEKRTTAEVHKKWKNLHSQAKKEFSGFTKEGNQNNWRRKSPERAVSCYGEDHRLNERHPPSLVSRVEIDSRVK